MASNIWDMLSWFFFFFIFSYVYPRFMLAQMIHKLEEAAREFEEIDRKTRKYIAKKVGGRKAERMLHEFSDFFMVFPSSLDPYGIVSKIDRTLKNMENKIARFSRKISGRESKELEYSIRALISTHQISKLLRHYVEIVKKYKNIQIGFIVQMQIPMLKEIMKSNAEGAKAFLDRVPVGDSIGPLLAASYMERPKKIAPGVVYDRVKIGGNTVYVLKADGPSPELGRFDEALKKLTKRGIKCVITVDASLKLEGEKTGKVSEGVGFAMGGIAQREIIENILIPKGIPLESVVCKMEARESISPMPEAVFKSLGMLRRKVEEIVSDYSGPIVLIGVGNTVGVGNSKDWVRKAEKTLRKLWKKKAKK